MEPDTYVDQVRRLSELAADVIAKHPTTTICESPDVWRKKRRRPTARMSTGGYVPRIYRLRREIVALPLPVSESLLDAFRRKHGRGGGEESYLSSEKLSLFVDATKTPLWNLNLENSFVNDNVLADLLSSHGRYLTYVNLSGCSGLTAVVHEWSKRTVTMNRLRVLNLGSLVKFFEPWLCGSGEQNDDDEDDDDDDDEMDDDEEEEEDIADGEANGGRKLVEKALKIDRMPGSSTMANVNGSTSTAATNGDERGDDEEWISAESSDEVDTDDNMMEVVDHLLSYAIGRRMPSNAPTANYSDDAPGSSASSASPPTSMMYDESTPNSSSADGRHKALERSSTVTLSNSPGKRRYEENSSKSGRDGKFIITQTCPNLQALILYGDQLEEMFPDATANLVAEFFLSLLHYTRRLLYLDLSYWSKMGDLRFLRPQRHVQTLVLFDVPDLYLATPVICSLSTLRHLDVSQSSRDTGQYPCPVTTLNSLVISLPHLLSLDISSTNLASNPTKGDFLKQTSNAVESDIVGLRSLQGPLEYLGIFYCDIAAHYHRIPAKKVAGDANESQILLAIEQFMKRPTLLLKVLNEAYQVYRFGSPTRYAAALQLMLDAMGQHVEDSSIQIAASASIFYIIRNVNLSPATKKRVVNALLTGMEEHLHEQTMVRNCCLSLCQFDVPNDLLFDYTRAARLLLRVIEEFQDSMTQRIVVYLLNSMACHVEGEQKVAVGELHAVERILATIRLRYTAGVCDEVMEVAWSFLWNITDETPSNCERFLNCTGMELFYDCYKKYPENRKLLRNMTGLLKFPAKNELLRNMMGLMGNIAEVSEMRPHLMHTNYISVFCELLKNLTDGIEISYNSAGVLSHMLSDGHAAWHEMQPSRDEVDRSVIDAIGTWQVEAKRFINYRSFEPILRLVPLVDSPGSQHWSIWALANLTTVDTASKYCSYVIHEGGMPLLEKVVENSRVSSKVRDLARSVLNNVRKWASENEHKL